MQVTLLWVVLPTRIVINGSLQSAFYRQTSQVTNLNFVDSEIDL